MKTLQYLFNTKIDETVEIWKEYFNKKYHYWLKTLLESEVIMERQYNNRLKKYNLKNLEV